MSLWWQELNSVHGEQLSFIDGIYSLPFNERLEERKQNLQKYSFEHNVNSIDRRSGLSQDEFNQVYDGKWPVILTDVITKWPAFNWTKEFLQTNYGHAKVTVKISKGSESFGSVEQLQHMIPLLSSSELKQWFYIEDELFLNLHPTLLKDIGSTPLLTEDFFSLFPEEIRPWNSMLLWGGAHSRSPLHIDPYNWTGTNAVLKGTKKWKLFPPGQDDLLYVIPEQRCGFPLECRKYNSKVDAFTPNLLNYPMFQMAKSIDFEQKSGELLIIPTGWYHQAYNSEETLAISSQIMNSMNYLAIMEEIIKVGNLQKHTLPDNFGRLSIKEQVRSLIKSLPYQILLQGRRVVDTYQRTREEL
ncbi:Hypothetical predicted protein [Octopus vulgaris]|uniref:JmjC domain-containing protein n=1 Tax=Octopus vulgaris TaxID=6645 RepID=A0AA36FKW2_OCTVU|nr:Hypothetical predicted protein [Octopus vulgaris]